MNELQDWYSPSTRLPIFQHDTLQSMLTDNLQDIRLGWIPMKPVFVTPEGLMLSDKQAPPLPESGSVEPSRMEDLFDVAAKEAQKASTKKEF